MTQADEKLTTVAAWGASEGISRQAAHAAVRRCRIPLQDGKVDPAVASALYRQRTRPRVKARAPADAAPPASADDAGISYQEARRRQAIADMLMAEREAARQAKQLCRVSAVIDEWGRVLTTVRSRLLAIPDRVAPQVPMEHAHLVYAALKSEIYAALTELSSSDGVPKGEDDE